MTSSNKRPHNRVINTYPIDFVENLIGDDVRSWDGKGGKFQKTPEHEIELEGYRVYTRSMRYKTFMEKGYTCVKCGRKGAYYALETSSDNVKRAHFNLYAEDGMLMTKDHIMP